MISILESSAVAVNNKERDNYTTPVAGERPEARCHHYWLIDRANGPESHAVCKYCREERTFSNVPVPREEQKTDGKPVRQPAGFTYYGLRQS